ALKRDLASVRLSEVFAGVAVLVTDAVSFAAPCFAAGLRGVLAVAGFLAAGFLVAGLLRFLGAPPAVVSAMMLVLALTWLSSGVSAFNVATQLAHQCSDE
ncbi:MAG: hypothetical protein V7686_00735, partial [Qipengyuania sp.]